MVSFQLFCMFVSMQVIYNFVSMALWYSIVMPLPLICVFRIALSIWLLCMEFKVIFSSMKNIIVSVMGTVCQYFGYLL